MQLQHYPLPTSVLASRPSSEVSLAQFSETGILSRQKKVTGNGALERDVSGNIGACLIKLRPNQKAAKVFTYSGDEKNKRNNT